MIALIQKSRFLSRLFRRQLQDGRFPNVSDTLREASEELQGRRFGGSLTRFRPAREGYPIGGERGDELTLTFEELREDLGILYEGNLQLSRRALDLYDLFAVRRDRLTTRLSQLGLEVRTLLAQQGAGRRDALSDSFNTLEQLDLERTTAHIDLEEGLATLTPNSERSVRYAGEAVRLVRTSLPPSARELGPRFERVFSQYRLDAWYTELPEGGTYEAVVNVTGADYEQGATEEILLNAIRIDPATPLLLELDWSPDGFNWHALTPEIRGPIEAIHTFHFQPVRVGYLRFRLRRVSGAGPVGIKRVDLLQRGFNSRAEVYSHEYRLSETVHTVFVQLEAETPLGTRVQAYVAQAAGGPWSAVSDEALRFDTVRQVRESLLEFQEEQPGVAGTLWTSPIPTGSQPLPETGELLAGRDQLYLEAYPFDWSLRGEPAHLPTQADWQSPAGEVRAGPFYPLLGGLGSTAVGASGFTTDQSPFSVDQRDGSFLVVALVQEDGRRLLQPGYNYRVRAYLRCLTPTTLENQRIGVVNLGGTAGLKLAPLSVYLNERKIYQQDQCVSSVTGLADGRFQTTLALQSGWNLLELLIQVPTGWTPGADGAAADDLYLYFQPNLFAPDRAGTLGVEEVRAYRDPWKRKSQFDLRYNTPIGIREAWAWKLNLDTNEYLAVLLNHDPRNSHGRDALHPGYFTLDGLLRPSPTELELQFPTAVGDGQGRSLYFRAELIADPGAAAPPLLRSYTMTVN